ncbi:MAG: OmpA family protein [Hyphomonadaceae bacterium]|nr:OmpA family protein [Hyphomonadaceae bacterium]
MKVRALRLLLLSFVLSANSPLGFSQGGECGDQQAGVIYFEWDKSDITEMGRALAEAQIAIVVDRINTCRSFDYEIFVQGHADTEMESDYSMAISGRRAETVRDELVNLGIPSWKIVPEAYGETRLQMQTPDGVREPINRRVEILIDFF